MMYSYAKRHKAFRFFLLSGLLFSVSVLFLGGRRVDSESRWLEKGLQKQASVVKADSSSKSPKTNAPSEPQDFEERCKAPGVLVCQGFDSPADFLPARWPASGLYPAWDKTIHAARDTDVKASGKGSLRLEILSNSAANTAGFWRQSFEHNFGPGSTFYVQFRQRFSKEMLANKWGDTTWKQVIFHNEASTCANVELTTVQYHQSGIPIMYTDCGNRALYTNDGKPPMQLQQGDYNCWFEQINPNSCFHYSADQWVTFYYEVSIGRWGKPESRINAWVALVGQPYQQWIKLSRFILKNKRTGNDYDTLTLLAYMTNKDMKVSHPTAYTWFDELIVSEKPIAPPK
jgi:hypothetical protein